MARTLLFNLGDIAFEWDTEKAKSNQRKHHVSFEQAATAFSDPDSLLLSDPDLIDNKMRHELLGYSDLNHMLVVVHIERRTRLRIISARTATPGERKMYEQSSGS